MRIPPALDGHGGSQRAWRLVSALAAHGPVHFVLLGRKSDKDVATVSLEPLRPMVASITTIDIPQWMPVQQAQMPLRRLSADWANLVRMRSHEAPVFSAATLRAIADQLPVHEVDLLFAGRLPCAVVAEDLMARGWLNATAKIADFDDIMSSFRSRQRQFLGLQRRFLAKVDTALIRRAERRIALAWNSVSVCTNEDVALLRRAYPAATVVKVPNVIDRPRLPPHRSGQAPRVLFVGNLSFYPNVQGLALFLETAWPAIRQRVPGIRLYVVGLHPSADVHELAARHGFALHGDVATVEPYYAACDLVICPVLVGSGTRIKILEAMAYGRAVVSTSLGAEGMGLRHGEHLLLADGMASFADAVVALARDPARRAALEDAARTLVLCDYGPATLSDAVGTMIPPAAKPHADADALAECA